MHFNIVVHCRDYKNYLRVFIDSLNKQTYKDFDLTILNVGNLCSTQDIKCDFTFHEIIVPESNPYNLPFIVNSMVQHSSGDNLILCNPDIYFYSTFLEELSHIDLEKEFYFCHNRQQVTDETTKLFLSGDYSDVKITNKYGSSGDVIVLDRKILKKIGGIDENYKIFYDCNLSRRLVLLGLTSYEKCAGVFYHMSHVFANRVGVGSMTGQEWHKEFNTLPTNAYIGKRE